MLKGEPDENKQKFVEISNRNSIVDSLRDPEEFDQIQEMSDFKKDFTLD